MAVSFSYVLQYGDILIYIVPSLVVYCLVVIFWIVFISSVKEFQWLLNAVCLLFV